MMSDDMEIFEAAMKVADAVERLFDARAVELLGELRARMERLVGSITHPAVWPVFLLLNNARVQLLDARRGFLDDPDAHIADLGEAIRRAERVLKPDVKQ